MNLASLSFPGSLPSDDEDCLQPLIQHLSFLRREICSRYVRSRPVSQSMPMPMPMPMRGNATKLEYRHEYILKTGTQGSGVNEFECGERDAPQSFGGLAAGEQLSLIGTWTQWTHIGPRYGPHSKWDGRHYAKKDIVPDDVFELQAVREH